GNQRRMSPTAFCSKELIMRNWILTTVLAFAVLFVTALIIHAQTADRTAADAQKDKRTITTYGAATIKTKPDMARVFFRVDTTAETIKQARGDNAASVKQVVDALQGLKIPDLRMKTTGVQVQVLQSHERDETHLPRTLGYRVSNSMTALISEQDSTNL